MEITRREIVGHLLRLDVEWDVEEDAVTLVDLLALSYTLLGVWTWLTFYNRLLDGTPILLLEQGKGRCVFAEARRLCGMVAT